jgi:prevent-host-death family protein
VVSVGVHEAKTHLSRLLRRVQAGEEIIIQTGSTPVAKLVPIDTPTKRQLGTDRGRFTVPSSFDDPLPDDVIQLFE